MSRALLCDPGGRVCTRLSLHGPLSHARGRGGGIGGARGRMARESQDKATSFILKGGGVERGDPEARGWRIRWSDLLSRAVPARGPGLADRVQLSKNVLSGIQVRRWGFPSSVVKGRHWTVGIKREGDGRPLPLFLCKISLNPWILWVKGKLSKKGFVEERC